MKKLKCIFVLLILLVGFSANSQTYNLTIENGYGSGTYNEGDTIHIWSEAVFDDAVFLNWTGNGTQYLTFDNEWHTTLIVPEGTNVGSISLTANFGVIPASTQFSSVSFLLKGENAGVITNVSKETFYAIPPTPKAIVFLLHGTGGSGEGIFSKYESNILVKDLVYSGYAVFTLDANEVTMGDQNGDGNIRWLNSNAAVANTENNIDIYNINALRDSVIEKFSFSQNIPSFTIGMSAGAVFSDICASALGFNASAHITAKGQSKTYTRSDIVPVIWIMSENDHNESADNEAAYQNYLTMNANQTAEWHWFRRSPVYPERFLRSSNSVSESQANGFFQNLLNNNYLDENNLLTELDVEQLPLSLLEGLGLNGSQKLDIYQQLKCVNADHVLHSDYNKNIIRFFNQQLTPTSIDEIEQGNNRFLIYPNPARNQISIQTTENINLQGVEIFNISGIKVLDAKNEMPIDISRLSQGSYFVKINYQNKFYTTKLTIVK